MTLRKCLSIEYEQMMAINVCPLEIFNNKDITFNTPNCMDIVNHLSHIDYDCYITGSVNK